MKTVFTAIDLARMQRDLDELRPPPLGYADLDVAPCVDSLRAGAMNTGLILRLRLRDGTQEDRFFNPVLARHIVACVIQFGEDGGWMDAKGNITFPPLPRSDA